MSNRVVVTNNQPNRVVLNSSNNVTVKVQPQTETRVVIGQVDTTGALMISNNLAEIPNVKNARTNLGLGSMALKDVGSYADIEDGPKFTALGSAGQLRTTFYDAGTLSGGTVNTVLPAVYGVYKAKMPGGVILPITLNLDWTGDNTFMGNSAPFGNATTFRVILEDFNSPSIQFTAGGVVGNIKWDGGSEPTFSGTGKIDIVEFMTVDDGVTWFAKLLYSNITA